MQKNSRIYVAGHRGMVGSSILRNLQSKGYENIITRTHDELDLTRQIQVEDFFKREKPDYVFLAAAKVGGILANATYKADFIYDNIMIAANIIHMAYKYKVKKLLNLGSSCIYPKFALQPMKEELFLSGYLESTNEPYAVSKIMSIKLCRYFNEQYGTNFISVMPTNLYGPNDNFNLETAHVLPALLRKLHLAKLLKNNDMEALKKDIQLNPLGFALRNEEILMNEETIKKALQKNGITDEYVTLWGDGEPYREFLHVDDLADACLFIIEQFNYSQIGEFVNIGIGQDLKIKDLALLLKDEVVFAGDILHDLSKPVGTPRKLLDVARIRKMGWHARIELKDGVKNTYNWYRSIQ